MTFDGYDGITVPDARTIDVVKAFIAKHRLGENVEIIVSNHLLIDWLRVAINFGKISHEEVEFYFLDKDKNLTAIGVNKVGTLHPWPKGFCDHTEEALCRLLTPLAELAKWYDVTMFDNL